MNLNRLKQKYQYIDKDGVTRDRTLNIPHYFEEIPFIYSPRLDGGRVKFSAEMQKLYCYVADWEKSGSVCYEEQSELANVCGLKRRQTINLINTLELIGLITRTKIPGRRNRELRALPLTDAHITPPEALTAQPVRVSDDVQYQPAPTTELEPDNPAEEHSTSYWDDPAYQAKPKMTNVIDDVIVEAVCDRLSRPESLRQSQRYDTFTAYARRVLRNDYKRLPRRIEERLEERFEQLHPHLYSRFDDIGF